MSDGLDFWFEDAPVIVLGAPTFDDYFEGAPYDVVGIGSGSQPIPRRSSFIMMLS